MNLNIKYPIVVDEDGSEYKMMTINQLGSHINRKTQQIYARSRTLLKQSKGNVKGLDVIYPYPNTDKQEDVETGPTFIVIIKKAQDYIDFCLKKKLKKK
jgi:hypothetical protein